MLFLTTRTLVFLNIFMVTGYPIQICILDNRPRFDLLREKYKNGDPYAEEEIWVPECAK
jgi:hypothetical protein